MTPVGECSQYSTQNVTNTAAALQALCLNSFCLSLNQVEVLEQLNAAACCLPSFGTIVQNRSSIGHYITCTFLDHSDVVEPFCKTFHSIALSFKCHVAFIFVVNIFVGKLEIKV